MAHGAMWKPYGAEFAGTFLMVLLGCGSIALGWNSLSISITFGFGVFIAIMIFQPISGAHINPAVSAAFAVRGDLPWKHLAGYITAQVLGGILAAAIIKDGATTSSITYSSAWLVEILITLLLMGTIIKLVEIKASRFTLALGVGAMVGLLAFTFGSLTGASMNPARSIGPNIFTDSGNYILYIGGPIIGAILATFIPSPQDEESLTHVQDLE